VVLSLGDDRVKGLCPVFHCEILDEDLEHLKSQRKLANFLLT
jgi:hypothetical protein